jgi:hypothetical protein
MKSAVDPRPAGRSDLDTYREQAGRIIREAETLFDQAGGGAASWNPPAGGWSVARCIDHLNRTGDAYLAAIDRAIEAGHAKGLRGPARPGPGWFGGMLVRAMDAPPRRRMRSPKSIVPGDAPDADGVFRRFLQLQQDLLGRLDAAEGLDLRRVRVTSPLLSLLRMNLSTAFGVVLAHERRHLWQAAEVVRHAAFPRP